MFTFLPVIHHELASILAPAPLIREESAPVAPPSWPAPTATREAGKIDDPFCVVRVAKGFSRKGFDRAPKGEAAKNAPVMNTPAVFFEAAPDWPAPARPAEVALKLPRRTATRPAETPAHAVEVERLSC